MSNEFFNNYQYDSCVSRGICSISPITSSLQSTLIMYLKYLAKQINYFDKDSQIYKKIRVIILNILPICVSYPEFTEGSFLLAINGLQEIIKDFDETEELKNLCEDTSDLVKSVRFGEKTFFKAQKNIPAEIRDLYNIMLVVAKNLAINLVDLESFEKKYDEAYNAIIKILNEINLEEKNISVLKDIIYDSVEIDNKIMTLIRNAQEERYGEQSSAEVSYSTAPSKAVLVVGSNIRELEIVLDKLKEEKIDVYTHDDMMLAHTFPKFAEYESLKGQFGQGLENCLLDFATFPGPIILTRHSLHNIENLYRGRLFTTDFTCPKGVVRILNNDFSEVIASAKESKGFKTGKHCESLSIGFDFDKTIEEIEEKLKNVNHIFIIGLNGYSITQKNYFDKLIKFAPEKSLIISFSYEANKNNVININTCFDSYGMIRVYNKIKEYGLPISIFIPKCDRSSISEMLYFKNQEKTNVFVGICTPIILNPSLMNTLKTEFQINPMTSVKKDLEKICLFD